MKLKFPTILLLATILFAGCRKHNGHKTGTFTDERDGKEYGWVELNDQKWMSENLAFTGDNGVQHQLTLDDGDEWLVAPYNGWCYYNDDPSNESKYGVLYQWEAALHACPDGWHLPSFTEMNNLKDFVRRDTKVLSDYALALAMASETDWEKSDNRQAVGNTDEPKDRNRTGFSALPAGIRAHSTTGGHFTLSDGGLGTNAYWWSSTDSPPGRKMRMAMTYDDSKVYISEQDPEGAVACRCVED